MRLFLLIAIVVLLSSGCRIDRPPVEINAPIIGGGNVVYICNEGNYQYGNASISYYDHVANSVVEKYYQQINQMPLGDVCQSMSFANGNAYLTINNSGKVVVVDRNTFEWKSDILGFTSPRQLISVGNSKAYVSEIFDNRLRVIDLNENRITKSILLGGESEEMKVIYGKAFITSPTRGMLYVVDTETDRLNDSINLRKGASFIREDKEGMLWVLCSGDDDENGALYKINPTSLQILSQFDFNDSKTPTRLKMNNSNDTLYFVNQSIYKMGISETSLPDQAFIKANERVFYALGINPENNDVYVADAIDYIQPGTVLIYSQSGVETNTFKAGIIPGNFYFE